MRDVKNIAINDDGNEYRFRLTKMSARAQSKWLIRLVIQLAKAGLLDIDIKEIMTGGDLMLDRVLNAILQKGFSFIGQMNADEVEDLILEMVEQTAVRIAGESLIKCDPHELDCLFNNIKSLFELYKQVLFVNFPMLDADASRTNTSQSASTDHPRGISIHETSRQA